MRNHIIKIVFILLFCLIVFRIIYGPFLGERGSPIATEQPPPPTPIKVEKLDDSKVEGFYRAYIITLPTGERIFTALRNGGPISHLLPPLPAEKK